MMTSKDYTKKMPIENWAEKKERPNTSYFQKRRKKIWKSFITSMMSTTINGTSNCAPKSTPLSLIKYLPNRVENPDKANEVYQTPTMSSKAMLK
jgi:hypothetical protein